MFPFPRELFNFNQLSLKCYSCNAFIQIFLSSPSESKSNPLSIFSARDSLADSPALAESNFYQKLHLKPANEWLSRGVIPYVGWGRHSRSVYRNIIIYWTIAIKQNALTARFSFKFEIARRLNYGNLYETVSQSESIGVHPWCKNLICYLYVMLTRFMWKKKCLYIAIKYKWCSK